MASRREHGQCDSKWFVLWRTHRYHQRQQEVRQGSGGWQAGYSDLLGLGATDNFSSGNHRCSRCQCFYKHASFQWKYNQPITLGWSVQEHLLCVQEDGSVYIHDMFGNYKHMFNISKDLSNSAIIDAKIFSSQQGI